MLSEDGKSVHVVGRPVDPKEAGLSVPEGEALVEITVGEFHALVVATRRALRRKGEETR